MNYFLIDVFQGIRIFSVNSNAFVFKQKDGKLFNRF